MPGPITTGFSFWHSVRSLASLSAPVAMGPGVRRDDKHDYRRQTGVAAAASPEMARVRPARTGPDDPLRAALLRVFAVGDRRHRHPDYRPSVAVAAGSDVDVFHLRDLHRRRRRYPPQRSPLPHRHL